MRPIVMSGLIAVAAMGLTACGAQDGSAPEESVEQAAAAPATPYKPVATIVDLMRGTVTLSTEIYWESVSVIVDVEGVHENMPETDEEWFEVWAAAMTLAESGNLLMMPPRAVDDEWVRIAGDLVDVGVRAAQVAAERDFEGMLEVGEQIYNVCVECHRIYVPTLPDL